MKKRGIFVILAGVPAWIYWVYVVKKNEYPGSEFGSAAYTYPTYLKVIMWIAFGSAIIGPSLVALDFVQWRRRKRNDAIY